ncbi:methionine ABC transporter permease [Clostridium tyrobutyricum]|uniref:methionine ABC transporter permease n=1 Tax=Clostridium tyrobutyricum TaxID=1519 RepID=UPI0005805CD7|nr:methionine ABC transporter permease [Clostridium tyrobutyricum]MBR9648652.1 ABC transporter permease [Clostridium tyrobutyricum]MBV4427480.1 ABC transporter permease [Clostridium tyrobutyricum]MBV4440389.1 ABC transporter permease [Clostridium tyrobutyricum]MBV4443782.1 ABC transporter permease [Clostridium tyrobutyricum]MBV4447409.1 ABC transporter permease [Clostridium tyrobutyricum]
MNNTFNILHNELGQAIRDSLNMIGIAIVLSIVVGGLIGLILYLTSNPLFFKNKIINSIAGVIVNIIRSLPFVILLVLLIPVTKMMVGTSIGPQAASVPLSIASIAFFARISEGAFNEVDKGVLEAAVASGAKIRLILTDVLIVEALPSLIRGVTVTLVSLIGFSAMAGIVGGGGIGDLAIRYGYYRYETGVMIATVIILVVVVQAIQFIGDAFAKVSSKR